MISVLQGKVSDASIDRITVLTSGGVGYDVFVGKRNGFLVGQEVTLCTYLKVSDTAMVLYGFAAAADRAFFQLLLSVKSVGPKSAMHIVSLGPVAETMAAIQREDVAYLTSVQGLGKKTAERIMVELKGKVDAMVDIDGSASIGDGEILGEVIDALATLGYSKEEAKHMVSGIDTQGKTTEDVLKLVLQQGI